MLHNTIRPVNPVSFGAKRKIGAANPAEVKRLKELGLDEETAKSMATINKHGADKLVDLLNNGAKKSDIAAVLRPLQEQVDDLKAEQAKGLSEQFKDLAGRLEAVESAVAQNAKQGGSLMKFIRNHKIALGASLAALLAAGAGAFVYSKHNKKVQAAKDAANPALYTLPPVDEVPQAAAVQAPVPSEPVSVSSSTNDYFVKTA